MLAFKSHLQWIKTNVVIYTILTVLRKGVICIGGCRVCQPSQYNRYKDGLAIVGVGIKSSLR